MTAFARTPGLPEATLVRALPAQLRRPRPRPAMSGQRRHRPDTGVAFAQILLKNSNFRGDHNSEDRWQPRWKFPWGLSGATDLSAYDPLLALAVASTRGDNAFPRGSGIFAAPQFPTFFNIGVMGGSLLPQARPMRISGDSERGDPTWTILLASISRWTRRMFAFLTVKAWWFARAKVRMFDCAGGGERIVESTELPFASYSRRGEWRRSCFTG